MRKAITRQRRLRGRSLEPCFLSMSIVGRFDEYADLRMTGGLQEPSRMHVKHILGGVDHRLFVLALLLIERGGKRIFMIITAFTVAHSITLRPAKMGWVHVPSPPVEAIIGLYIVFVCTNWFCRRAGVESNDLCKMPTRRRGSHNVLWHCCIRFPAVRGNLMEPSCYGW
jgi:HupE / UreJ protein